jgi:hypothetical protein
VAGAGKGLMRVSPRCVDELRRAVLGWQQLWWIITPACVVDGDSWLHRDATELHAASFLNETSGRRMRDGRLCTRAVGRNNGGRN